MTYIVWTALLYSNKDITGINEFFAKQGWGQVKYVLQFKTKAGQGGEGGRNDVVFKWATQNDNEVGKFSIERFKWGGFHWLGDYIANNSGIIPSKVLTKLKAMRDKAGDYGAGTD